jgi:type III pantothenate kinase
MSAPPTSRFLAVDAGNSSVKAATWDGAAWSAVARFAPDAATPDAWAGRMRGLVGRGTPSGLCSVVPGITAALAEGVHGVTGAWPVTVSARLPLPFAMGYRTPETLGADRIAAAVAAFALGRGRPVVALDAGTAVTLDAVDVQAGGPVYLGGAIAPGPGLLVRSLARGTDALPEVPFDRGPAAIGGTTAEAIQTGAAGLFLGGVARLLDRTAAALSSSPFVVATGGWAPYLVENGLAVDAVVPTLVLDGVRLLCAPR